MQRKESYKAKPFTRKPSLKLARTLTLRTARGFNQPSYVPFSSKEKKFFDVGVATYQVNTTGSFTLIHAPVPGSDYTNRIGRKTIVKSLYIRGSVKSEGANGPNQPAAPGTAAQLLRMIIFVDNQPNGAVPVVADLLVSASPASHLNPNNRDRFKILCDKEFVLDPYINLNTANAAQYGACNQIKAVKKYKKLNIETIFNAGTAGTIADINSGAIYMFWIGDQPASTNYDANAIVATRIRFDDS